MSILEEFGDHQCEVCGTDCIEVEEQIDRKNAELAALKAEVERLDRYGKQEYRIELLLREDLEKQFNEIKSLREQIERLSAPVSDAEWIEGKLTVVYPYPDHNSTRECMLRPVIDALILARKEGR